MSQYKLADKRYKTNIVKIQEALELIKKVHGYEFEWNEVRQDQFSGKDYGFIAQEIMGVIPKSVKKENKQLHIDQTTLIPFLVQCIHELDQRNTDLEIDVEQLKNEIKSIKTFFKIDKEEI